MSHPGGRSLYSRLATGLVLAVLASALLPGSEPQGQRQPGGTERLRRELRKF